MALVKHFKAIDSFPKIRILRNIDPIIFISILIILSLQIFTKINSTFFNDIHLLMVPIFNTSVRWLFQLIIKHSLDDSVNKILPV